MLTEDYIMRMINQALAVIMAALGLKKAGKYREALQSFGQAKEMLLGIDAHIADHMEDTAILNLLTSFGRLDIERLQLLADIYFEEIEIYGSLGQAESRVFAAQRSLRFYLEVALSGEAEMDTEVIKKISEIRRIDLGPTLPGETCLALLDYLERLLSSSDEFLAKVGMKQSDLQVDFSNISSNCKIS